MEGRMRSAVVVRWMMNTILIAVGRMYGRLVFFTSSVSVDGWWSLLDSRGRVDYNLQEIFEWIHANLI